MIFRFSFYFRRSPRSLRASAFSSIVFDASHRITITCSRHIASLCSFHTSSSSAVSQVMLSFHCLILSLPQWKVSLLVYRSAAYGRIACVEVLTASLSGHAFGQQFLPRRCRGCYSAILSVWLFCFSFASAFQWHFAEGLWRDGWRVLNGFTQ